MAIVGYSRISTSDQNAQLQTAALTAAGCDRIEHETISGKVRDRPVLEKLVSSLDAGDTLLVWRLDRLGRSARHLLNILADLDARQIRVRSLGDAMDTSTASGRMAITVLAAVAQMETERSVERIHAGIAAAKLRPGHRHGRKPVLSPAQIHAALQLREQGTPLRTISTSMKVCRTTLWRALKDHDARQQATCDAAAA